MPEWECCGEGAGAEDPAGCRGARVAGERVCFAHLGEEERAAHAGAGGELDCRGVTFTEDLLTDLLVRPVTAEPMRFGSVNFAHARFRCAVDFGAARFFGDAVFEGARFEGDAVFDACRFEQGAWFKGAVFGGAASFGGTEFGADAGFGEVTFEGPAWFGGARFEGRAWFTGVRFRQDAAFLRAQFLDVWETGLSCAGTLSLVEADFARPLHLSASAVRIDATRAQFQNPVTVRARHAAVDLTQAHLLYPCSIATDYLSAAGPGAEDPAFAGREVTVSVTSVRGVDAALLLLSDVDLSRCSFAGTHHLDQLRLEGRWDLAAAPHGVRWSRGVPRWCTKRQVIEEERQWRALPGRRPASRHDWGEPPREPGSVPGLATLTSTYRQLRKAREDAKDEPGAADFYYGEMEMRRYSHSRRHAERWLLQAYWLLSGYGLRASRALGWLAAAMTATVLLMTAFGLPDTPARAYPPASGVLGDQAPRLQRPLTERFTADRAEKAADVVVHSVVFRSSGRRLTTAGTYVEMASRLTEPALLALAVLAVRGRVKRGS